MMNGTTSTANSRNCKHLITFFWDQAARSLKADLLTLEEMRDGILQTVAAERPALPWLKMARFGDHKTDKGSLRNNKNTQAITGVEGDYDGEKMSFEEAVEVVRRANLRCLLYTSPSHAADKPRWRVLFPTSAELPPGEREKLLARANGVFGGIFDPACFTLSQGFLFGHVEGSTDHAAVVTEGDFIDLRDDLDAGAIGRGANGAEVVTLEGKNPFEQLGTEYVQFKPPIDVEARLANMKHKGEGDSSIHLTQLTVTSSLLERGWDVEDVVMKVLRATKTAVDEDASWDWSKEETKIRVLCTDWLKKHPPKTIPVGDMNTDLGNARRLVRHADGTIKYVPDWKCWLVWRDDHWRRDEDGAIMRMSKATVEGLFKSALTINDEDRRKALLVHAVRSQSAKYLRAMISLAETELPVVVRAADLDADPYVLGVQNGVLELKTQTFRQAQPEDYVTKRTGCAYDPGATCPEWEKFLKTILPEEKVGYFQRLCGYCLTGLPDEEVMFIFYGTGSNGKSTAREILRVILNDYAVTAGAQVLMMPSKNAGNQEAASPSLAGLKGARLLTINETPQDGVINEERVKAIACKDRMSARRLYENTIEFDPSHKPIVTTNHKPVVKGTDEGIWRRIQMLKFEHKFEGDAKDPAFRQKKLEPELPGILNWMLRGLKSYLSGGLCPPQSVLDETKEYRDEMDLIGQWLEENCSAGPNERSQSTALFNDYKEYAQREIGWHVSQVKFVRILEDKGFRKGRDEHGKRIIKGLRPWADFLRPHHGSG